MLIQQGDVLLVKVDSIPLEAIEKVRSERGIVLAEGEVTGHAHVITDHDVKMFVAGPMIFLSVTKPSKILHEEHKAIAVPEGIYEVRKVQEYDHFAEEARNVTD